MTRRNIRIVLAYDGTQFCGWQSQASGRTVQDVVEGALRRLLGDSVRVHVAGRTDSGVHASGQVINFPAESSIPSERFAAALNQHLPPDVRALRSDRVEESFDARFDARVRVYKYYLDPDRPRRPVAGRYAWTLPAPLDVALLSRYAAALPGSHDFSTFAAAGDSSNTRMREVFSASFYQERGALVFKIAANAFLYRMVRSLVGTMVELERRTAPSEEMGERLRACDRKAAGQTAPAWGLFLHKVLYDERQPY